MAWKIELITKDHKNHCAAFDCGVDDLNEFLKRWARPNTEKGLSKTFLACDTVSKEVQGFFTVSTGSVSFDLVPDHETLRLPHYPVPTVHIGRFAIASALQNQGLGGVLFVEAMIRVANAAEHVGVYAIDLVAFNEGAKRFYTRRGFTPLKDNALHLFLPIEAAKQIAAVAGGGHPPN